MSTLLPEDPEVTTCQGDHAQEAVALAEKLLTHSQGLRTSSEQKEAAKLAGLMADTAGKELTFYLTDRILRTPSPARSGALFRALIRTYGLPCYLSPWDRCLMQVGALASTIVPGIVMPAITNRLREESKGVVLPAHQSALKDHRQKRESQGAALNLNLLGEAVLSETEANHRLQQNLKALHDGSTSYLSIKLSAVFSQINLTAYHDTMHELAERLRLLYRAAQSQSPPAFVNLDMEEYRDLHLTLDVFRKVLSEPEFLTHSAGIVLQGYLPDAYPIQRELTDWARQRCERGGAPIKVRLVKGANLAMERIDADLHHWPQAPYLTKAGVDANYKRMLAYGCEPENARVVHLGVGSHNLFDLAYALVLREAKGVSSFVSIEMLEGMAAPQARAVLAEAGSVLFYAPAVARNDFEAAIAYLIRRLDENTTEGNFLRDLFEIAPGNEAWLRQRDAFLAAYAGQKEAPIGPRRLQNRNTEIPRAQEGAFRNEADTDFSLPQNREWLQAVLSGPIPAFDCSPISDSSIIEKAIQAAVQSPWSETSVSDRTRLLRQCAVELARSRGDLIAIMHREANKVAAEGDVEVSEAIDFANYYADRLQDLCWQDGLTAQAIGPVLITPPWNFPCAIPCGGILAALAAGNAVIIKPAPEVRATARAMVEALWRAGIPADALQFLPVPDDERGQALVTDPRIAAVILTGSSQTAHRFLQWRPELRLHAETSGKNALVITAAADPDLAIKDLVKSAFGHAGQKCSAASLALVERTLLEKSNFLDRLREAASSLPVGPTKQRNSVVTPLLQAPSGDLLRGLSKLDEGERWLLEPTPSELDPHLWSPGIRIGVRPGSWIHGSELFGPVLAIIPFDTLEEAIAIQNSSSFGLTGGIHSLDPAELNAWREQVQVGNCYLNRSITGAIVQRQPFGGWKASSLGPGAKAGGPNYLAQFGIPVSQEPPKLQAPLAENVAVVLAKALAIAPSEDHSILQAAAGNAAYWWQEEFSRAHDPAKLAAESNDFRYRPVPEVVLRLTATTTLVDVLLSALMAATASVPLKLSSGETVGAALAEAAAALALPIHLESEDALSQRLREVPLATLRTPGCPMTRLHGRNHHHPVVPHARMELLPYLLEQSLSQTRHRHGRIDS